MHSSAHQLRFPMVTQTYEPHTWDEVDPGEAGKEDADEQLVCHGVEETAEEAALVRVVTGDPSIQLRDRKATRSAKHSQHNAVSIT